MSEYVPKRGDIVWINLDPTKGHEQAGERPVLVLSNTKYNDKTGMMVNAPITKNAKQYAGEIPLPDSIETFGVVLSDHIRNLDWVEREARFSGDRVEADFVDKVLERLTLICSEG